MPPAVAYAAMAAGAGLQAKGAHDEAKSEQAILKYNMKVAQQEADLTRDTAARDAADARDRLKRSLARNQALVGASGVAMAGSPFQAQLNLIEDAASDIAMNDYNAEIEARKKESQVRLFDMQRKAAKKAGKLGVATALVGGVSDIVSFKLKRDLLK